VSLNNTGINKKNQAKVTIFKRKYPIWYKINILESNVNTKSSQYNFHFLECGICDDNDDNDEFLDNGNRSD